LSLKLARRLIRHEQNFLDPLIPLSEAHRIIFSPVALDNDLEDQKEWADAVFHAEEGSRGYSRFEATILVGKLKQRVASELPVILPELAAGAEITSYKPTSHYLS
jgi:hypothetical protein